MGGEEKKDATMNAFAQVAGCWAAASVGIVVAAFLILRVISDVGMCAIAVMAFAPAWLGIGMAYFMSKQPPKA